MLELLKQHFGYDAFRPGQEAIISNALAARHGLVVMPTGGGKSLCYQLPALALGGLTLVVSPLIALMKDQVDGLRADGIAARVRQQQPGQPRRCRRGTPGAGRRGDPAVRCAGAGQYAWFPAVFGDAGLAPDCH